MNVVDRTGMSVRVLLVTRFRDLSMKVAAANRGALTIVHVAWLSDAIRRLKQTDFHAVIVDLGLPDAKGLEALHALMGVAPHVPILVLGDEKVLQQMKVVEHGAQDYLLKHRLDADTLMPALHGAIARKTREGILLGHKQRAAQMTLNSIEDAVLSTDSDGLITFLNPIAERLVGWTYAEAAGRHLLEVFQVIEASTRERVMPRMESKAQLARATILPPNCLLVRRDGHESAIQESAAPTYDRSGNISGMVVLFHDVSESRAAQTTTRLAEHDILGSLTNRALINDLLTKGLARAPRRHTVNRRTRASGNQVRVALPFSGAALLS